MNQVNPYFFHGSPGIWQEIHSAESFKLYSVLLVRISIRRIIPKKRRRHDPYLKAGNIDRKKSTDYWIFLNRFSWKIFRLKGNRSLLTKLLSPLRRIKSPLLGVFRSSKRWKILVLPCCRRAPMQKPCKELFFIEFRCEPMDSYRFTWTNREIFLCSHCRNRKKKR